MDEPRYNVCVTVDIKADTGENFFDSKTEWTGVRYVQAVAIEDALHNALEKLIDVSYAVAEARGADPQEIAGVRSRVRGK